MKKLVVLSVLLLVCAACVAGETAAPQGLYFTFDLGGGVRNMRPTGWYFAPDGTVETEGRRGKVAMRGDRMTITWSDGTEMAGTVDSGETYFRWNDFLLTRLEPLTAQALVGTWKTRSSTVTFREDGTFDGGRWQLDGPALTLTDTAGKAERRLALPLNPNEFVFGDQLYRRTR